jgi:hypothetical protein
MIRTFLAAAAIACAAAGPATAQEHDPFKGLGHAVNWLVKAQFQPSGDVVSRTLGAALQQSRDDARVDSRPIPPNIRRALSPFYDDKLMETVRYKVGDTSATGLAGFAIRNGNAAAVTLIDTVVFKEERFANDVELWAHEMHHVEQYKEWGLGGFATRYAFNWGQVESAAEQHASDFMTWYKKNKAN